MNNTKLYIGRDYKLDDSDWLMNTSGTSWERYIVYGETPLKTGVTLLICINKVNVEYDIGYKWAIHDEQRKEIGKGYMYTLRHAKAHSFFFAQQYIRKEMKKREFIIGRKYYPKV